MAEETLKEKTAKGLFWGGVSNGLQQVLTLVFGVILLRILDPSDYGVVGMLAIFTGIANTILDCGFTTALTNKKEFKHKDYNAVFWFSLFSGIALYIILFFSAPLIARFYEKPVLTNLSRFLFLSFLFGSTGVAHHAILFKNLMVKERAKIDIISLFLSGIVGVILALNGFAYWGLAAQTVVYVGSGTLLRWYFSPWRPTFNFDFTPIKEMFSFSSKLFLTNIFWQISSNIYSVVLGKFYNEKEVGLYSQGNKWMGMGNSVITGMINGVAQPVLIRMADDKERQKNVFRKMLRFGAFVSFPLMLGFAFISRELFFIVGGEKWIDIIPIFQILCIWGAASYINTLYSSLLFSHGKSDVYMWNNILVGSLQILVAVIMYPLGLLPMVVGYVISSFIGLVLWHYFANKQVGLKIREILKDIFPYLFISLAILAVTWFLTKNIENVYLLLGAKIFIAATIYIVVMWGSRSVIFRESIEYLKKL